MRKFLATVLALVLALSMATVAFAADKATVTANNTSADVDVKIVIEAGVFDPNDPSNPDYPDGPGPGNPDDVNPDSKAAVYRIDIDATDAEFKYTFDSNYDAGSRTYKNGKWNKESANIKVVNSSNTAVNISAKWKNNGVKNGVTGTLSNTNFNLKSGVNTPANGIPSNNIGVKIDKNNIPTVYEDFVLDSITVTIKGINL